MATASDPRSQLRDLSRQVATSDKFKELMANLGQEVDYLDQPDSGAVRINGIDVCGRVSPSAGAREGTRMRLAASLDHMHLIDDTTGRVI